MAWTFGTTTSDRVNFTNGLTMSASQRVALITGWWKPTTLTAGRTLWSVNAGGTTRVEIDTTTDELRLVVDHTTDSVNTTTGVDLAADSWTFLAFLLKTANTGPISDWRVWRGTPDTGPTEVTVTNVTPAAGNPVGSSTFVIGNAGTSGTVAFQGQIADVNIVITGQSASSTNPTIFNHSAVSTGTTQQQADWLLERIVEPVWRGDYDPLHRSIVHVTDGSQVCATHVPLHGVGENALMLPRSPATADTGGYALTVGGSAAASEERGPRHRPNVQPFSNLRGFRR